MFLHYNVIHLYNHTLGLFCYKMPSSPSSLLYQCMCQCLSRSVNLSVTHTSYELSRMTFGQLSTVSIIKTTSSAKSKSASFLRGGTICCFQTRIVTQCTTTINDNGRLQTTCIYCQCRSFVSHSKFLSHCMECRCSLAMRILSVCLSVRHMHEL